MSQFVPLSSSEYRWDKTCRGIIHYGLLGLIVFAPLPAGSVTGWALLVIQLAVVVMMAAYFLMRQKPRAEEGLNQAVKWPRYLFLALWIVLVIQIFPLPKFVVRLFSPAAISFRESFSPGFSKGEFSSFSLIPSQSFQSILALLPFFLIGFLILRTVRHRSQIIQLYTAMLATGVFEAFYGLFELYNKNPRILFYEKVFGTDVVSGTFVNRNHFSGYMEMIIPLGIGLIIARIDLFSFSGLKWRDRLLRLSEKGVAMNILLSFGLMIMAIAVIFSKSRSGVFLLLFTFILFFVLTLVHFSRFGQRKSWIRNFLLLSLLIIVLISLYIGVESSFKRFRLENIRAEARPTFWANTLRMFGHYPLFGIGLGNFSSLYPNFVSYDRLMKISHAHNDYLEFLVELGIVGFILLFAGVIVMMAQAFLVWRQRRYPLIKGLALGGLISLTCILIHSFTDFNLQIPANRLLFTVVLSLTMVSATFRMKRPNDRSGKEERSLGAG